MMEDLQAAVEDGVEDGVEFRLSEEERLLIVTALGFYVNEGMRGCEACDDLIDRLDLN